MFSQLRERIGSERGFTLIELLVVILIIGILAAIAIPAFLNQRQKGQDTEAKSLARTAQTTMESCATENNGNYNTCDKAKLVSLEPAVNDSAVAISGLSSSAPRGFTITVTSDSTKTAIISRDNTTGVVTRSGTVGSW